MKKNYDLILRVLEVISWIVFIGLCVDSGAFIFRFIYSIINPVAAHNIFKDLALAEMQEKHFALYIGLMSFIAALSLLKAYLFNLVINIFRKLNLVKPFNVEIAKLIEKISYETFTIAIVSMIADVYTQRLIQSGYEVSHIEKHWNDVPAFLMMAAIIYIIAQIFNKGIELQTENDLTV